MSRGTTKRTFRCPDDEWNEIVRCAEFRNKNSADVEDTLSDFIRKALREKVNKMARCRGRKLTVDDEVLDLAELDREMKSVPDLYSTLEDDGAIA